MKYGLPFLTQIYEIIIVHLWKQAYNIQQTMRELEFELKPNNLR